MTLLAAPNWFYRLLGLSPKDIAHVEQMELRFTAVWPLWALTLLLAVSLLWFAYNYWRDGTRPSWWLKGPLVLLRLIAVASLLFMLAQPTLRLRQVDTIRPGVALLVDTSDSMRQPDKKIPADRARLEAAATGLSASAIPDTARLDRVNALLNNAKILPELLKKYNVRLYTFAGATRPIALPSDSKQRAAYRFDLQPDEKAGDSTQMGKAIRTPLEELAGQPLAGALVISDGGSNQGEDPILVADEARKAKLPISTVGLGDPTKTKDVALLSVLADDVVRTNNTVSVYAALSHRGYAGKNVTVTLQKGSEVVGRENVRLGRDDEKQEVRFTYVPTQAGQFDYTVLVTPLPGENTRENNKKAFPQTVVSKKLKVLYVEGEPRYEYRYLKNAILRDTSLEFACILLSADDPSEGNIPLRVFPRDEKSLFDFDIVILGDVPRSAFSDTQLESLRRFVEDRGASLLVVAGELHMPHEYAGTPLEAVLPVAISSAPNPLVTEEPFKWQLTPEGRRSPITLLEDSAAESQRVWEQLPGMFWAAGVPRSKPGATVLAVHSTRRNADGPYVLAASQPFGAGRSFIQLVDSTWRWRWRVGDRHFYRYWGQVLRTLTPKEIPGNSRYVQINADRSTYQLGQKAILSARLLNAFYRPIKAEKVTATVKLPGGQTQVITLQAAPGSPGLYTAEFQPERVGRFQVTLVSPANPQAKASTVFVVESLAVERQQPELNESLLKKVAAAGGGKYYSPDKLADWLKSLPNNTLKVTTEQENELWDAPLFLIIFLTCLSIEWLIRKRKGLL